MPIRGYQSRAAAKVLSSNAASVDDVIPPTDKRFKPGRFFARKMATRDIHDLAGGGKVPTFEEIGDLFSDEEKAIAFMEEMGIIKPQQNCPRCQRPTTRGSNKEGAKWVQCRKVDCCWEKPPTVCEACSIPESMRYTYDVHGHCNSAVCSCNGCNWRWKPGQWYKRSIYKGSLLENCKLPKNVVLHLIWLWLSRVPVVTAACMVGVTPKTAGNWFRHFRQIVIEDLLATEHEKVALGGVEASGEPIEIEGDESKFARRKYNKGRRVSGDWVFGMVERTDERKMVLVAIPDRKAKTLLPIIKAFVKPGSMILTDGHKGYNDIVNLGMGCGHKKVIHAKEFVAADGTHTQTIEGTWGFLKRQLPLSKRTGFILQEFLWEAMWRRLHRKGLWSALLSAMAKVDYSQQRLRELATDRKEDFDDSWVPWKEEEEEEELVYDVSVGGEDEDDVDGDDITDSDYDSDETLSEGEKEDGLQCGWI